MALKTFDLYGIIASLREEIFSKEGGRVALVLPDIPSREYLLSQIIQEALKEKIDIVHLTTSEEAQQKMNELSLFSTKTLYVANQVSFAEQKEVTLQVGSSIFLLLDTKALLPKETSSWRVIAFPVEKPWELQGRIAAWVKELFRRDTKIPSEELIQVLSTSLENDFMRIANEVEKICLFASDETNISLQTAAQIATFSHSEKEWNIAESIVWNGANHVLPTEDHTEFFRFLGLLRYHLHLGLSLSMTKDRHTLLKQRYPKMIKKADKVYMPRLKTLGKEYFIRGNMALNELERNVRTSSQATRHYWDIFIINMRCHI